MSTIKELAETCGVSEQAIRKWCARNQVSKDIAKHYPMQNIKETSDTLRGPKVNARKHWDGESWILEDAKPENRY